MKKYSLLVALIAIGISAGAQGLEFRLKGGANFQNSKLADKDYSFLPQFGMSAGIRISTIGFYVEVDYSTHEDINGSQAIPYIIQSLQFRFYTYRFVYAEAGLSYILLAEDIEPGLMENVDKEAGYYLGLGATFKRFEIGLRTATKPATNIQLLAAIRF